MKTQVIHSLIGNCTVESTTDGFIVFKTLETAGNAIRLAKGKSAANMGRVLESQDVQEFVLALVKKYGGTPQDYIKVVGRGSAARRLVCIQLAVKLAMKLDSDFELEVIDEFIGGRLHHFRLEGGEQFKHLNAAIDTCLPDRKGKDNKGCYIQCAKRIRERCAIEPTSDTNVQTWNQETANSVAQQQRYEIERKLTDLLRLGLVRDWEHLKELIDKV